MSHFFSLYLVGLLGSFLIPFSLIISYVYERFNEIKESLILLLLVVPIICFMYSVKIVSSRDKFFRWQAILVRIVLVPWFCCLVGIILWGGITIKFELVMFQLGMTLMMVSEIVYIDFMDKLIKRKTEAYYQNK